MLVKIKFSTDPIYIQDRHPEGYRLYESSGGTYKTIVIIPRDLVINLMRADSNTIILNGNCKFLGGFREDEPNFRLFEHFLGKNEVCEIPKDKIESITNVHTGKQIWPKPRPTPTF